MRFRENGKREISQSENGQFFQFCGKNMKQIEEETEWDNLSLIFILYLVLQMKSQHISME